MRSKTLIVGMVVIAISVLIAGIETTASSDDLFGKHGVSGEQSEKGRFVVLGETQSGTFGVLVTTVTPIGDELLGKYEKSNLLFKRMEIGNMIVYGHHRMIDDAIVEGDRINYQFNRDTKELKKKMVNWRDDLPEYLPIVISKEEAESIAKTVAKGKIMNASYWKTHLCYISPDSRRYPIKPMPKNPCWIVPIADDEGYNTDVIIIDAVEGEVLGHGVPVPSSGFSFSGPQNVPNCSGAWEKEYQNATYWFERMGYPTEAVLYPDEAKVKSHIQSYETAMLYEMAHGDWFTGFQNDCSGKISPGEIRAWIDDYTKMPFTFIHSCGGMCYTGLFSLSDAFRKGSTEDTVTVGTCFWDPNCNLSECIPLDWQDALFNYMNQGWTVKKAFDQAVADFHPDCDDCVRFAGDETFKVVPVVERGAKRPTTIGFSSAYEDPDYWYHIYGFEVMGIGASITYRVSKADKTLSVHETLLGFKRIKVDKPLSPNSPVTIDVGTFDTFGFKRLEIEEWGLVPYGSYEYAHAATVHFHCWPFDDTDWTFLDVYGSGFTKVFDWEFSDGISEAEKNAAMAAFERGEIPQRLYSFILNGHAGTNDIYEPDDDWHELTEDTIAIGETQTHSILPATENDWLRFALPAESAVTMGIRSHSYALRVELFDSGLNYKAGMTGVTQDVTTEVLQPGTYYVKITSAAGDDPVDQYEFFVYVPESPADWTDAKHLADIEVEKCVHDTGEILPPGDTDWYNFTLLAAFDVEIEIRGDENRDVEMWLYNSSGVPTAHIGYDDNSGEGLLPKITAQGLEPDTYYFKVESKDNESLLYSIVLKAVTPGQLGDSYEDDDTYDKARLIADGETQTHSFYPAGDEDWVKFTLASTTEVTVETSGPGGDADTEMWLYIECPTPDADTDVGYTSKNDYETILEDDFSTAPWNNGWSLEKYFYWPGWSGGYIYQDYDGHQATGMYKTFSPSLDKQGYIKLKLTGTYSVSENTPYEELSIWGYSGSFGGYDPCPGIDVDGTTNGWKTTNSECCLCCGSFWYKIQIYLINTENAATKLTYVKLEGRKDAPPYRPGNPSPDNCAINVDSGDITLSWEGGDPDTDISCGKVRYDVYLSTSKSDVESKNSSAKVCSDITTTSCTVHVDSDKTYYWKVVAKSCYKPPETIEMCLSTNEGDVWSFHTGTGFTQVAYNDNYGSGSYSKITATLDAGTYYVKVKEKNDNVADNYNIKLLVGTSPYASFTYTPSLGLTTGNITFNASDSYDTAGTISSYSWDFNASDGIQEDATGVEVTHQYTTAGNYTVTLTVTGTSGTDTVSKTVTVKAPPVAYFSYSGSGTEISFTDLSTDPDGGEIIGWYWDFEDGTTNGTQNPTHVFEQGEMDYVVTLVVMDNDSLVNRTIMVVHAGSGPVNEPPDADFTYSQDNLTVQFNSTSTDTDGSVTGWLWEFGDGTLSLLENVTHNYTSAGTYTVNLTVTDDDGATDSMSKVTNVSASVIYVNTSGWWYEGEPFNPSSTPIQDAVNNASAGCCNITVKDGIYSENVNVNKRLVIQSENGSANCIINAANPNDHVFEVTTDYVNISGFTVKDATGLNKTGIYLYNADHCIISNNIAANNYYGIELIGHKCTVKDNIVQNNTEYGIYVLGNYNKIYYNVLKYNGDYGIKVGI